MSRSSKSKALPSRAQAATKPRRTKWWAYVLLILALALAWPAYWHNLSYRRLTSAQNDMARGNLDGAIGKLEAEVQSQPQSGEATYWLAVAHRRAGRIKIFNEFIERAKSLKYPADEIERQILLSFIQTGLMNDGIEQQADALIAGAGNYRGARFDLFLDEFYEARVRGYMANYHLQDADVALSHWIEARPDSIQARMFRALVKEREERRFQAAEDEYRKILELEPEHFEARFQYARLLLQNQQVTEAAVQYEACLKAAPNDTRVQLALAECEYRGGKEMESARHRLEALLGQDQSEEDRAATLILLGEIARFQKKPDLVVKYLTEAIELPHEISAAPYRSLSAAYASLQQSDQSKKYLAIAQRKTDQRLRLNHILDLVIQDPTNAELRYEQGIVFDEEGRPDQAKIWWTMAVRFDPDHLPAHVRLAAYYSKTKNQEKAEYHLAMAARAAPKMVGRLWKDLVWDDLEKVRKGIPWLGEYPDLREDAELLTMGLAVAEGKEPRSATERLQQLTGNPRLAIAAVTLLGEIHRRSGNYAAARGEFEQVLATNPQVPAALWGLQKVCRDTGAFADMEKHALTLAELDVLDYRPHRVIGEQRMRNKKWTSAILEFRESLRLQPEQPEVDQCRLNLAECLIEVGKLSDALQILKETKSAPRKSYLEARCHYASKEINKASKLLDTATRPPADYLPSLILRADIALAHREPEVADRMLSRALKLAPQSSEPHRKMAVLLRQKGELDSAIAEEKAADELAALEARLAALTEKASRSPLDISSRKGLAVVLRELGREVEAEHWETVVHGMSQKLEKPSVVVKPPAAEPGPQKRMVAPAEKPRTAGPARP